MRFVYKGLWSRRTFVQNQFTMLKLLFWGFIGYIVYRYYQMKAQLKEGRRRDFMEQQNRRDAAPEKKKNEGEFIDYEEIK